MIYVNLSKFQCNWGLYKTKNEYPGKIVTFRLNLTWLSDYSTLFDHLSNIPTSCSFSLKTEIANFKYEESFNFISMFNNVM